MVIASPEPEDKRTYNNPAELSTSTKSFNMFEKQPRQLRRAKRHVQFDLEPVEDVTNLGPRRAYVDEHSDSESDSDSDSDSSSSSGNNFNQGSVFLHRSKIMAKSPPKFNDSDDDDYTGDDDEEITKGFESIAFNDDSPGSKNFKNKTTESSFSNLSCMYANMLVHIYQCNLSDDINLILSSFQC